MWWRNRRKVNKDNKHTTTNTQGGASTHLAKHSDVRVREPRRTDDTLVTKTSPRVSRHSIACDWDNRHSLSW